MFKPTGHLLAKRDKLTKANNDSDGRKPSKALQPASS